MNETLTFTAPVWFLWLMVLSFVLSIINHLLSGVNYFLRRKLGKLQKEKTYECRAFYH